MPFMDGLKMISYIKKVSHNIPIILTTAYTDNEYLMESINLGVTNYLVKPIDIDNLISLISKACTIRYEEKEIKKIVDKMSKNNFNNISDFFHKFHEFLDEATCIYKLTDNITYDVSTKMIIKNDEQITLNNQEVIVLEHLLKHKDKIIKYETLLNQMSKTEEASIATLRTIIKQLRNKIDKSIIKNVSKIGYKVSIKI
jgi:DNA-binding response OmpR family regulator